MQSDRPMPGDPWPHDMVIEVDEGDHLLLPLLFVNIGWALQMPGIPPLDPVPDTGRSRRPGAATVDEWRSRWRDAWGHAVAAPGVPPEPPFSVPPMQNWVEERALRRPRPFTQVWGDDGFDGDAYWEWVARVRPTERHSVPIEEHPERRALPALIGAWRRGLRTIVTLPFATNWSAQAGPHRLLIAAKTREDTGAYSTRLELFGTFPPRAHRPAD